MKAGLALVMLVVLVWLLSSAVAPGKIFGRFSYLNFVVLVSATYLLSWCFVLFLLAESLRSLMPRFVLTTSTFLSLLLLLEVPSVFGLIDYRKIISPPGGFMVVNVKPWDNPGNLRDSELIYRRKPGAVIVTEASGDLVNWLGISTDRRYPVNLKYDGRGFRNDKDLDSASIALIGDSFVEGVLIPHDQLVSSQLQSALAVPVVNLGLSGYGPQQELIVLRRFALGLKPKVVLWFFFEGNDLLDVPRYESLVSRKEVSGDLDSVWERSFLRNALFTLASRNATKLQHDSIEAARRSATFIKADGTKETFYFAYGSEPLNAEEEESLKKAQSCFLEAAKLSAEAGTKFILVYVPSKFRVYKDLCEFPEDGYSKTWQPNKMPEQMKQWAYDKHIEFLDLTPSLQTVASKGELLYFPDDDHWNAYGNQVVATAIERRIQPNR